MSELWTTAELKHYHRTGEEPGAQPAAKKKPTAPRRTAKRSDEMPEPPLSVEAAWQVYKVKVARARAANVEADVALTVYAALSEEAEKKEG